MFIETQRHDGVTLLVVEGVIKLGQSAAFLAEQLKRVLENESGDVAIELSKINYIDSTGIGELVGYLGRFQKQDRKLMLVGAPERITKLMQVAKLDSLFEFYDTVDAAVARPR